MNGINNRNVKKKYDLVFLRSMVIVIMLVFRFDFMFFVLLVCRIDLVFRVSGSAYRIGIIDNWFDWLRYENMTVSGLNVRNISKFFKAIYFSLRLFVYKKFEDSFLKYMRVRCFIFVGEMIVNMKYLRYFIM